MLLIEFYQNAQWVINIRYYNQYKYNVTENTKDRFFIKC